ncbi:hypothetical protein [Streptomyces alboflavus]|uniref:hypothetical protein n=1 Tax=Streptomyces alboflavus TaxID=67267 RepID=UPI0036959919
MRLRQAGRAARAARDGFVFGMAALGAMLCGAGVIVMGYGLGVVIALAHTR